jgi:hypothetical protein
MACPILQEWESIPEPVSANENGKIALFTYIMYVKVKSLQTASFCRPLDRQAAVKARSFHSLGPSDHRRNRWNCNRKQFFQGNEDRKVGSEKKFI